MKLNLSQSNKFRYDMTQAQAQEIAQMYGRLAEIVRRQEKRLSLSPLPSAAMQRAQLNDLENALAAELAMLRQTLNVTIPKNMHKMAEAMVVDNSKWGLQFGIQPKLAHVPTEVVQSLISGELYEGNWSLSSRLWQDYSAKRSDIHRIIAEGVALNKGSLEIAQDLEKYVDPNARKEWDWSKVYPGTAKKIDYNAQRLARTMVSHAYQQSLMKSCKNNPFVSGYKWLISNSDRVCPLCIERASNDDYGLGNGIFPKDDLPMDHPNGMCTFEAVIVDSMTDIADRIADWALGKEDPALDKYAEYVGFESLLIG